MGVFTDEFLKAFKPRTKLTGSGWADLYRYVAPGTSPEPGEWRTSRVPYLREPMDKATDRATETVVLCCSSQVGKSEALLCVLGFFIDQEPAPQLMLQPTVEMAESFSILSHLAPALPPFMSFLRYFPMIEHSIVSFICVLLGALTCFYISKKEE